MPCLLQGSENPAHSAIATTHQHAEARHLGEEMEPVWEKGVRAILQGALLQAGPTLNHIPLLFSNVHL